jgi:hypothetical protein
MTIMTGMPAPAGARPGATAVQQQAKRTGLLRMAVGSSHLIALPAGPLYCQALDYRDLIDSVEYVYFCQHPECQGRTWKTHEEMRKAHPESAIMAKTGQAHVYGLWSADVADPKALEGAKAELKRAQKDFDEAAKMPIANLADREAKKEIAADLEKAKAAAAVAGGCHGLIAPPEPRTEDV